MSSSAQTIRQLIREVLELDLEIGDIILTGKFKNKRTVIKKFGKDKLGQPTINDRPLNFRIEKLLPKDKWSKQSQEEAEINEARLTPDRARDIFGDYLFGDDRQLPEHDPEWNTAPEDALGHRLYKWFHGRVKAFARRDILMMQQLRVIGMYHDVLEPPWHATAWRYTPMSWEIVQPMLTSVSPVAYLDDGNGHTGSVYRLAPGELPIHLQPPEGRERFRQTRSWTITPSMFDRLAGAWGGLAHSLEPDYPVVFFQADVDSNREHFLLNPAETASFAAEFAYQNEILQVGPVTLSGGFVYRPDRELGQGFGCGPARKSWDRMILNDLLSRT